MSKRQPGTCWCGADALPGAPLCQTHNDQSATALANIAAAVARGVDRAAMARELNRLAREED